ncbi:MAG: sulfite exporter TauE/SafE family protein [Oscillospiraceae bacterium]|nr:sulfite exporter TauE/SafE family protein [Oscillospiraceae bacterium]
MLVCSYFWIIYLSLAFGVFLIVLAFYFFAFSERITMQANRKTAALCAMLSGITSGFFGIGGPLMAIYFISAIKEKESYIGTIQFLFAFTNIINLFTRIVNGIFTIDLLPATILGFAGITMGKTIGLHILDRTDPSKIKKLVYAFVGISGILTLL